MTIRLVTDSTADIPQELVQQYGIHVIPAYINMAGESYLDGIDLSRPEFYERLPDLDGLPTTAAPATGVFTELYSQLADEGATDIISLHISTTLSAFLNVARLGAEAAEADREQLRVHLWDSRQLSMGLGLQVITAAQAVQAGRDVASVLDLLRSRLPHTYVLAALDTMEFLRRSGRVNWTEFSLGTLLRIKPLIIVYDGEAKSAARVRTFKRAVNQLLTQVTELAPLERLAVLHTNAPAEAEALRENLRPLFPGGELPPIVEVTPTIGAHIGPGAVGVACVTRPTADGNMV